MSTDDCRLPGSKQSPATASCLSKHSCTISQLSCAMPLCVEAMLQCLP